MHVQIGLLNVSEQALRLRVWVGEQALRVRVCGLGLGLGLGLGWC